MRKTTHKHVGVGLASTQKGITLIALVITIIILLILAGVAINLVVGDNGIINHAKRGGIEYTKAQLKEEIEHKITAIEMDKLAKGENLERNDLNKLSEIGATLTVVEPKAEGTYKGYEFTVDENYKVTIGEKAVAGRPKIELMKNTEELVEEVTIKVKAIAVEGTIESVTKPDGTTTTEAEFDYKVKENRTYTFTVRASNGLTATKSIEITNVKEIVAEPVISANYGYPVLKTTGIEIEKRTEIKYDTKQGLENYYSLDNGNTWNKYTGPFEVTPGKVMAKSVKQGATLSESSKEIDIPTDRLGAEAYDGRNETYFTCANNMLDLYTYDLVVDQSMIGKKIKVFIKSIDSTYCNAAAIWVFEDGTTEYFVSIRANQSSNSEYEIPKNVVRVRFEVQRNSGVYEVQPIN